MSFNYLSAGNIRLSSVFTIYLLTVPSYSLDLPSSSIFLLPKVHDLEVASRSLPAQVCIYYVALVLKDRCVGYIILLIAVFSWYYFSWCLLPVGFSFCFLKSLVLKISSFWMFEMFLVLVFHYDKYLLIPFHCDLYHYSFTSSDVAFPYSLCALLEL